MFPAPVNIVGILLAGGASRRFGSNKLAAAEINGVPIGIRCAERLHAAVDEMLVVVPGHGEATAELFEGAYDISICEDADEGIGRSIAHGVGARPDADGWLIVLADMPFIDVDTIREVAAAVTADPVIARPRYHGREGHPVAFGAKYRDELMDLQGDVGAQSVVNAHRSYCVFIDTEDAGVVADIDRPEDLGE